MTRFKKHKVKIIQSVKLDLSKLKQHCHLIDLHKITMEPSTSFIWKKSSIKVKQSYNLFLSYFQVNSNDV